MTYAPRDYRAKFSGENLTYWNLRVGETDLEIGAGIACPNLALEIVRNLRKDIIGYIEKEPSFLTSLEPLQPKDFAPSIVRKMCLVGKQAGVGPMASVAGAIAHEVGLALLKVSPEVIVENGGDIFMATKIPRKVGILSGSVSFGQILALVVEPKATPLGISTSSGTQGHALSFGKCDAAVILSPDPALSDAVATATGNRVFGAKDLESAVSFAASIPSVTGVLLIKDDKMAVWGDIKLTRGS